MRETCWLYTRFPNQRRDGHEKCHNVMCHAPVCLHSNIMISNKWCSAWDSTSELLISIEQDSVYTSLALDERQAQETMPLDKSLCKACLPLTNLTHAYVCLLLRLANESIHNRIVVLQGRNTTPSVGRKSSGGDSRRRTRHRHWCWRRCGCQAGCLAKW